MKTIEKQTLTGERALYHTSDLKVVNCTFCDGESPLKECRNIRVENSSFEWKYPIWYDENIEVSSSYFSVNARAGMWYLDHVSFVDCIIDAPKEFRRCRDLSLENCKFTNAEETLWACKNVKVNNCEFYEGGYLFMNSENLLVNNTKITTKYIFDGAKNVEIHNSNMQTRDAFWNCENVIVYDSYISSEYIGWNSKNLKFVNCEIESLQGFCYIDNLVLENCKLPNTDLTFEFSKVNANVVGPIISIKNPIEGKIECDSVNEIILDENLVDVSKTEIIQRDI